MTKDIPPNEALPGRHWSPWLELDKAAELATRVAGHGVSADDIIDIAVQGLVRLDALIPGWEGCGVGEIQWFYPDGSAAGPVATDGVAMGINPHKLCLLAAHGRVKLSGLRWQTDQVSSDAGLISLVAGPDSPFITREDLRILKAELSRVAAVLNGDPYPAREQPAVALCTDRRKLRVSADESARAALYNRWQELAGQICELRDSERNTKLPPTEREAATRLRTQAEKNLCELESDAAFVLAIDALVSELKAQRKAAKSGHGDCESVMELDERIESWQAHATRIRGQAPEQMEVSQQQEEVAEGAEQETDTGSTTPPFRQPWQESEILRVLLELEYDPKHLPRSRPGTPGPKTKARKKLTSLTPRIFDKAWERLRANGGITDAG